MVVEQFELWGSELICRKIQAYWPLLAAMLAAFHMPETHGRCDLNPLNTHVERFRFYSIECILLVCLMSGAFKTSDPSHILGWLNVWALYAFVSHEAWARLLPSPYGAILTYSCGLLFYCL